MSLLNDINTIEQSKIQDENGKPKDNKGPSEFFKILSETNPEELVKFTVGNKEIPLIIRLLSTDQLEGVHKRASIKTHKDCHGKDLDQETIDNIKANWIAAETLFLAVRDPEKHNNNHYVQKFSNSEEIRKLPLKHLQQLSDLYTILQDKYMHSDSELQKILENFDAWIEKISKLPESDSFLALATLPLVTLVEICQQLVIQYSQQLISESTLESDQKNSTGDISSSTEDASNGQKETKNPILNKRANVLKKEIKLSKEELKALNKL